MDDEDFITIQQWSEDVYFVFVEKHWGRRELAITSTKKKAEELAASYMEKQRVMREKEAGEEYACKPSSTVKT